MVVVYGRVSNIPAASPSFQRTTGAAHEGTAPSATAAGAGHGRLQALSPPQQAVGILLGGSSHEKVV